MLFSWSRQPLKIAEFNFWHDTVISTGQIGERLIHPVAHLIDLALKDKMTASCDILLERAAKYRCAI